jgi:transcriptional regulator with XRE-family HTH domain
MSSTRAVIGQRILELRESRMTRTQLARRSKISRSHLWHIEQGHIVPGLGTLEKISEALNVCLPRLFSRSEAELLLEDTFIRAMQPFLRNLDCRQRQLVLKTVEAAPRNARES